MVDISLPLGEWRVAQSFLRSTRFLRSEAASQRKLALVSLPLFAAAWGAWLVLATVTLHAVSRSARLEADRESHPLDAPIAGTVAATALQLDRAVTGGEVLVELDSSEERLMLEVERSMRQGLETRLAAVRAELALAERLRDEERNASQVRLAEARARDSEAQADAQMAEADRERRRRLLEGAAVSAAEWEHTRSFAERRRAAANAVAASVQRIAWDVRTRDTERRGGEERLRQDVAEIAGDVDAARGRIAQLEHAIAARHIAAPVGGRLGEVSPLCVGQFVKQGQRLAAVVPEGRVRIVAEFDPEEALGRIVHGAPARLRLHGFPWTQYGSVAARVESVGREVRDGVVRVELAIADTPPARIPLQHGVPGTVQVDVERISPLDLLLRLAGRPLAGARGR